MKFCVLCAWRGHLAEREVEDRFSSSLQLKSGCPGKKQHAQAGRFTTKPAQRAHCTSNSACRTCHPVPWLGPARISEDCVGSTFHAITTRCADLAR